MIRKLFIAFLILGAGFLIWLFIPIQTTGKAITLEGNASAGAYLARISGCIACHTNWEQDGKPLAGGPKLETDFGIFAAPNLTMSKKFGIGDWTLAQFDNAVRRGISSQGKPYYPAFPFEFYKNFSDQDIADLWAAFNTVKAIDSPDPQMQIRFPFSIRQGLKLWRVAFFSDSTELTSQHRGEFLVKGPTHCGACHTPRNLAGAMITRKFLNGNPKLPVGGSAPDISALALKNANWTREDLVYLLQTGSLPDGDSVSGSMGEAVRYGLKYLNNDDKKAIADYLLQ